MKKITFLAFLLISSLGFSQNLLENGDFETGDASNWGGNSDGGTNLNVIDDGSGSNFVNESVVNTASDAWRVGLTQVVALTEGETYTLSFTASSDVDRTITAGIGKNGGDFFAVTEEPAITSTPTDFSFDIVASFDTVTDDSRVLFDLASVASTVTLDNISLTVTSLGVDEFASASFKTFPNPTNSDWNISANSTISSVRVYDVLGKQVVALEPNANETKIDASELNLGVYFARIESVNGSKTIKLIKN